MAGTSLGLFTPGCAAGPCRTTLSPAGPGGTFSENQPSPGDAPAEDPVALTWDGRTYSASTPTKTTTCTLAGGKVIAGGYTQASQFSLTFVPGSATTPARLSGTSVETVKATPAGKAKGCTDFIETRSIGGAPTGSLAPTTAPAGGYDASLRVAAVTPKTIAAVGTTLWLGPVTVSGGSAARRITGLTKSPAALSSSGTGWSAQPAVGRVACAGRAGSAVANGASATEVFTGLHAVALTADGKPIFSGEWTYTMSANAAGSKAGCGNAKYEGRILLVPGGAG